MKTRIPILMYHQIDAAPPTAPPQGARGGGGAPPIHFWMWTRPRSEQGDEGFQNGPRMATEAG